MPETRFEAVRRILNVATDQLSKGQPFHDGLERFWNLPRDEFVGALVYEQQVIVVGDPDGSALIKSLKGVAPFDNSEFERMPMARPPVSDADIAFVSQWIADGCPEHD